MGNFKMQINQSEELNGQNAPKLLMFSVIFFVNGSIICCY